MSPALSVSPCHGVGAARAGGSYKAGIVDPVFFTPLIRLFYFGYQILHLLGANNGDVWCLFRGVATLQNAVNKIDSFGRKEGPT